MNETLNAIISKLLEEGCAITMYQEGGDIYYDLNTDMKSDCSLKVVGNNVFASTRYQRNISIWDFDDVISTVIGCICGRQFMNPFWERFLTKYNYINEKGEARNG